MKFKCQYSANGTNCDQPADVGLKEGQPHYCRRHYQQLYRTGRIKPSRSMTLLSMLDALNDRLFKLERRFKKLEKRLAKT